MSYDPHQSNNPDAIPPPPGPGYSYPPPPGPGYGYPPPGAGYPPYPGVNFNRPPAPPLPLSEAIKQLLAQYLRVITKPGTATFFQEKSKAAWNIIWFQIAYIAVLNALFIIILYSVLLPALFTVMQLNSYQIANIYRGFSIYTVIGALVFMPILLFASVGLYYLMAKAFKGQGTFIEHMYSYMLIYIPQMMIAILVGWIPIIGSLVLLASGIYMIVLQVYMTMAVHRLSGGRATLAVLILPIIGLILGCSLIGILVAFTMHMTQQMQ
jgi:hypothetical protein